MNKSRDWLKKIREQRGLTQEQVASEINVSRSYYTNIELGQRGSLLPVRLAIKIANVLDFDWQRFYEELPADKN